LDIARPILRHFAPTAFRVEAFVVRLTQGGTAALLSCGVPTPGLDYSIPLGLVLVGARKSTRRWAVLDSRAAEG